jgi:hypothetical protein
VAKLDSDKGFVLDSGGAITFEGVEDLHDESHTKTNNNAAWVSAKGRGQHRRNPATDPDDCQRQHCPEDKRGQITFQFASSV